MSGQEKKKSQDHFYNKTKIKEVIDKKYLEYKVY